MAVTLPFELRDKIVDDLYFMSTLSNPTSVSNPRNCEYVQALRSCLFVSSDFRFRVLGKLFERVSLSEEESNRRKFNKRILLLRKIVDPPRNLSKSFEDGIAPYIKSFSLTFSLAHEHEHHQKDWARINRNLNYFTRKLRGKYYGIKTFQLAFNDNTTGTRSTSRKSAQWSSLHSKFRYALGYLMKSPFLASVSFRNIITFPATLFDDVHYSHLYLEYDPLQSWADPLPSKKSYNTEQISTPQLQTFYTDLLFRYQDLLTLRPLLTNLKCLETSSNTSEYELHKLSYITDICAHALERVSINLTGNMASRYLNLSTMANLKSLSLDCKWIFINPNGGARLDGLTNIYTFFNIPHAMNKLRDISIRWRMGEGHARAFGRFQDPVSIQMLLSFLSGSKYPALHQFSLTIQVISVLSYVHVRHRCQDAEKDVFLVPLEEQFKNTPEKLDYRFAVERLCLHVEPVSSS
ncbi:hypothetical protein CPB84DRAFT_1495726 [Gymnopilus junonius]|uniref:Uncharacterized protein n=1 Tax=Gymnopilus junonius TaxID=109634 RepID=A0A9P5NWV4_GYMJU|nr:hypothetical protein CPB84DRAFT_1495726 [Gymnopilus junonius]